MSEPADSRWGATRAREWIARRGWRFGCNFAPSSAANQLEMWQDESFDLPTIERELGLAAAIGMTSVRIFLHDLLWSDPEGLIARLDAVLAAAAARKIGVLLVLFDGVWDPHPHAGPQPEPRPHVHNSRWLQSPGAEILADSSRQEELAPYVQGLLDRFRDDSRIDGWDLFNEPDNPNPAYLDVEIPDKGARAFELLRKAFAWAREAAPSQPLTVGVWRDSWSDAAALSDLNAFSLEASDVVSFHHYGDLASLQHRVEALRRYERPVLCTEFLARGLGSTFDPHLGWMHEAGVGAYCWGLVAGRIQTEYGWDSWATPHTAPPDPWHHDVLHRDGTPYDATEIDYIRSVALSGPRP
jgi:hypothetical protein